MKYEEKGYNGKREPGDERQSGMKNKINQNIYEMSCENLPLGTI